MESLDKPNMYNRGRFFDRFVLSSVLISLSALAILLAENILAGILSADSQAMLLFFRCIRIAVGLLILSIFFHLFRGEYNGSLSTSGIFTGAILCFPAMVLNILFCFESQFELTAVGIVSAMSSAVFEEAVWRGIICSNGIRVWHERIPSIFLVILVSLLFSVSHFMNLLFGQTLPITLFQCMVTFGIGSVFTAVFIRCGNLVPIIIVHFINNAIGNSITSSAGLIYRFFHNCCVSPLRACLGGLIVAIPLVIYSMFVIGGSQYSCSRPLWVHYSHLQTDS